MNIIPYSQYIMPAVWSCKRETVPILASLMWVLEDLQSMWLSLRYFSYKKWKIMWWHCRVFCWFGSSCLEQYSVSLVFQIWAYHENILFFMFTGDNRICISSSWDWSRSPQKDGSSSRTSTRKCDYFCFIRYFVKARSSSCSDSWKWCSKIRPVGSEVGLCEWSCRYSDHYPWTIFCGDFHYIDLCYIFATKQKMQNNFWVWMMNFSIFASDVYMMLRIWSF